MTSPTICAMCKTNPIWMAQASDLCWQCHANHQSKIIQCYLNLVGERSVFACLKCLLYVNVTCNGLCFSCAKRELPLNMQCIVCKDVRPAWFVQIPRCGAESICVDCFSKYYLSVYETVWITPRLMGMRSSSLYQY